MTAVSQTASPTWFWIVTLVVIGAIEINALIDIQVVGKKLLDSLAGTLAAGFVLLAAFYILLAMFR